MGSKPTKITKQWADSPFQLIETPRKRLGVTILQLFWCFQTLIYVDQRPQEGAWSLSGCNRNVPGPQHAHPHVKLHLSSSPQRQA
jgi:hypothetical protein